MKRKKRLGNCFKRSFELLAFRSSGKLKIDRFIGPAKLVHGIVFHPETGWHVHAWVEDDLLCYDEIRGALGVVLKQQYYKIGKIKEGPGEIFKYSREEAFQLVQAANSYSFSKLPCEK